MTDKFAAEWEKFNGRHKGTRVGTLWANANNGSGDVTLTADFLDLHPIDRADVLKDCIYVLEAEYEKTLQDMRKPRKGNPA